MSSECPWPRLHSLWFLLPCAPGQRQKRLYLIRRCRGHCIHIERWQHWMWLVSRLCIYKLVANVAPTSGYGSQRVWSHLCVHPFHEQVAKCQKPTGTQFFLWGCQVFNPGMVAESQRCGVITAPRMLPSKL